MPSRSSEDDEVRSRSSKDDEVPTPSSKDDEVPKLSYEVPSRSSKHYEVPSAAAAAPGAVLPACGPSNPPSLCFVCGRLIKLQCWCSFMLMNTVVTKRPATQLLFANTSCS